MRSNCIKELSTEMAMKHPLHTEVKYAAEQLKIILNQMNVVLWMDIIVNFVVIILMMK